MTISELISKAWDAVEKSGVPKEIQIPAFNAAMRILASEKIAPDLGSLQIRKPDRPKSDFTGMSEDEFYARIVERTNVDKTLLERLVLLEDGEPKLIANAIKGNMNTADSIRAIAQVLTISRTLGLGQQSTPLKMIKAECNRLNRNDAKNFMTHVKKIENFTITTKDKIDQLLPRPAAFDAFSSAVEKLLGNAIPRS